ncbi:MAG TPA: hypothetical protein VFG10_05645 [Saprospiraceae bacterium]|nr:hypothetical protein [Saprospiraceae bacterium]
MKQYDPIRKKLTDFKVEVDKNKLWEQTSFAIPQKKKRRVLPIILLTGSILLGAGYIYHESISIEQPGNKSISNPAPAQPSFATQPTTSTQPTLASNNEIQENLHKDNSSTLNISSSNNSNNNQAKKSTSTGNIKTASSGKTIQHKEQNNNRSNSTSVIVDKTDQEFIIKNTPPLSDQTSAVKNITEAIVENPLAKHEILSNQNQVDNQTEDLITASREDGIYALVNILPLQGVKSSPDENNLSPEMLNSIQPAKHKNTIMLSLVQGIGFSTMDLTTSDPELNLFREKWKPNLRSLEVISTSLHGSLQIGRSIHLGAGLQYSQLTSQLDYTHTITERITGEGITTIIIDENGHQQSVTGNAGITRERLVNSSRYTYHTKLDLESKISIHLYNRKGIHINAWMKGGINLHYAAKGSTFDTNNDVIKFSAPENPFSLSSPFTYGGGFESELRLNKHWILMGRIAYDRFAYDHMLFHKKLQSHHEIFSLSVGFGYML